MRHESGVIGHGSAQLAEIGIGFEKVEVDVVYQISVAGKPFLWHAYVVAENQETAAGGCLLHEPDIFCNDGKFGWWGSCATDQRVILGIAYDLPVARNHVELLRNARKRAFMQRLTIVSAHDLSRQEFKAFVVHVV